MDRKKNTSVQMGYEKWYEYHDKVGELVTQRDAYNRGMMGQLDGEKAQTASEKLADTITTRVRQGAEIKENIKNERL